MAKIIQRQVGRWSKRMPDEGDVGSLIDEVNHLNTFIDNLIEYTGNWRKSWTAILEHQAHLAAALAETYQDIPGSNRPEGPTETPAEVLDRTARYAQVQHDIKDDLATDIVFVERAVIGPLMDGKGYLKPIMKYIQKRDDKKLDYEKYYKLVENYKAKPNPSKREASILAKGELDLEEATITYRAFDDALRAQVPPLLHRFSVLFPIILDAIVTVQNTFFAAAYTSIVELANSLGFGLEHDIVREWEVDFLQVQQDVEHNLSVIRQGMAVRMPMHQLEADYSLVSKIKGKSIGPRRPAPPPVPNSRVNSSTSTLGSTSPTQLRRPTTGHRLPSAPATLGTPSISSRKSAGSVIHDPDEDDRHSVGPPKPNLSTRPTLRTSASNISLAPSDSSYHAQPQHSTPRITSTIRNNSSPQTPQDASWIKSSQSDLRPATSRIYSSTSINSANVMNAALSGPGSAVSVTSASMSAAAKKKPPPPPPKKKPVPPKQEEQYLVALFDFAGDRSQGDLNFKVGDKIRVIKGSGKIDDWWEGECNGITGVFPRNYTELA